MDSTVKQIADVLRRSRNTVAFTGAGISADSGLATFRGKGGKSLSGSFRPNDFRIRPLLTWMLLRERWGHDILNVQPNAGHLALADLQELGIVKAIITQNIDCLHLKAGSFNVFELHGSIDRLRCVDCGFARRSERKDFSPEEDVPWCPECHDGVLKPNVVFFGDQLPRVTWEQATLSIDSADTVLVVGSTGSVFPAASLPIRAARRGVTVIQVDPDVTEFDHELGDRLLTIRDTGARALPQIVKYVKTDQKTTDAT